MIGYLVIDGKFSDLRDETCGVPQGQVLVPTLFLIIIIDAIKVLRF